MTPSKHIIHLFFPPLGREMVIVVNTSLPSHPCSPHGAGSGSKAAGCMGMAGLCEGHPASDSTAMAPHGPQQPHSTGCTPPHCCKAKPMGPTSSIPLWTEALQPPSRIGNTAAEPKGFPAAPSSPAELSVGLCWIATRNMVGVGFF